MPKQKNANGVGYSLMKRQQRKPDPRKTVAEPSSHLESSIERSDLDELLSTAILADRDFTAERGLPQVVLNSETVSVFSGLGQKQRRELQLAEELEHESQLTIPRRPPWNARMSAEEVDNQERKSFLEWRRGLARLEDNEKLVLTPFEKNLDIWRQLWRVLERSHVVVTVVDARNPLFYRCKDLEVSVAELDASKRCILLLNKADLLPFSARKHWAMYFKKQGVGCLFWSAVEATARLEGKLAPQEDSSEVPNEETDDTRVLGREALLERLEAEALSVLKQKAGAMGETSVSEPESAVFNAHGTRMAVVGFVGYPNVGKSSTINALVGQKRTGVTSTPGKTKHFQTLHISETLMLCDCPGLVFPSFSSNRSEMVAAGVLPIDRITDHRGPVEIVAERVPRSVFESVYGIVIPKPPAHEPQNRPPNAAEVLRAYSRSRGYVASSGLPDETRASRLILKDYLSGKLLDYHLPPTEDAEEREEGEDSGSEWEEVSDDDEHDDGSAEDDPDVEENESRVREGHREHDEFQDRGRGERELGADMPTTRGDGMRDDEATRNENISSDDVSAVTDDWDSLSLMGDDSKSGRQNKQTLRAPHKMHKKGARKKDRTWRVGHGGKDDSDGMPIVKAIQTPLSHGAARLATVLPKDRHLVGL